MAGTAETWPRQAPLDRLLRKETLAFAAFAALQTWLIFTHAPWVDEEHALLIARAPFSELLGNLKYEGHPALWYLYLGLVDRVVGGTPLSLPIAVAPLSIGILALVWLRSPFPFLAKALLGVSYFLCFEYGVISRSYALGALLLLGAVTVRETRWAWLLLALAANCSAHDLFAAVALGALLYARREDPEGLAVLLAGILIAFLTVTPAARDLHPTAGAPVGPLPIRIRDGLEQLSTAFIPSIPSFPYKWMNLVPLPWGLGVTLAAGILGALALPDRVSRLAFCSLFIGLVGLAALAYALSPRHAGVLFVFLVCGLWLALDEGKKLNWAAWTWLVAGAVCGAPFIATAYARPFSHSIAVADWIKAHGLANETWGAWPGLEGPMITTELGRPTANLEKGCLNTFVRWDYPHEMVPDPAWHVRAAGVKYVVSETPIPGGRLLAHFEPGAVREKPVSLYQFPGDARRLPSCR